MDEVSDEELYARWTAGDEGAGDLLTRRRLPGVRRVVHSLLQGEEAHDAVQEVFARLAKRARAGGEIRRVKAFVSAVARNVVHEQLRGRKKVGDDLGERSLMDLRPNQSVAIQHKEDQHLLLKALHRMPVDDQILLALRYWEQLRTRELAEIMELKHGTLRTRLHRAEVKLQKLLTELADSPEALQSTMGSLTGWARDVDPR